MVSASGDKKKWAGDPLGFSRVWNWEKVGEPPRGVKTGNRDRSTPGPLLDPGDVFPRKVALILRQVGIVEHAHKGI